ncbi:helix-turn-helix domain-containing protein [Streptomyces sp. NPDC017448]|uniref:helix-turn-helix domain-containing protein n=1 Tax=Streptomyces sp. NPDC017448 TaxID=3364996 RepID=UPI0037B46F94
MTSATIEHAVHRVISNMRANLGQDLTIDDMARTAMFSKFHFTRIFRDVTGTSPGRFLSALRIQEAKRLLVQTQFSVADISSLVGYSSVGTFSSRFKACVGVSPSVYRELEGFASGIDQEPWPDSPASPAGVSGITLRGHVTLPAGRAAGPCYVGLFPTQVPQGRPVRCSVLEGPGAFELRNVPVGTWYLLVHSVPYGQEHLVSGAADEREGEAVSVGRHGPLTVQADTVLLPVGVALRPLEVFDPPVLMALLDLRTGALESATG